tara:strand:+ start:3316 stop:5112 length:1797 start_codon:yes stop_codon:yes gene_type:complete
MPDDQKKILPIDYTHREYESIRQDLMEVAERFYPDTFQDFSEASFGSLMLDAVAYVGDQLSFYLDYNVNESFLDTAYQYSNVVRHGRILGYKDEGRPSTYGRVTLYILVPATTTGLGPDTKYIPILKKGSRFTSTGGQSYVLTENVDFASPVNPIVVARINASTGAPTYYAIRATGTVVSGYYTQETVEVGAFQRFKRIKLAAANVSEITSVTDSEGNEYFEVDYMAQDIVFKELPNNNFLNDNVASVIKPYLVTRKYVVERDRFNTYLQFGSGNSAESNVVADPQSVAINIYGKDYVTDITFDPTRLTLNKNYGIVPSNTTLTVVYRTTNPTNSNTGTGTITQVTNGILEFTDRQNLVAATMQTILDSIEVSNESPIMGNVTNATTTEIKRRIFDTFPTQNRAVTQSDYENLVYRMPAKFGSIKRCSVQKDADSLKRNLNMYVISEDEQGLLVNTNSTIKNNLKTWINQYRMINDTVDILDPYIINIGINFIVRPTANADKYILLDSCVQALKEYYSVAFFIGEPIYISSIYSVLKGVTGVLDVVKASVVNKTGGNYAGAEYDINSNLSPDGDYLIVPKNAILEFKYPEADVKGRIR